MEHSLGLRGLSAMGRFLCTAQRVFYFVCCVRLILPIRPVRNAEMPPNMRCGSAAVVRCTAGAVQRVHVIAGFPHARD